MVSPGGFDVQALFDAIDRRRVVERLSWAAVADQMWQESEVLNHRREDHPISASTITNMPRRGDISCQQALFMLRWLGRSPEEFIAAPHPGTAGVPLPAADEAHRLRWNVRALYDALDAARTERGATWAQSA